MVNVLKLRSIAKKVLVKDDYDGYDDVLKQN